MKTPVVGQTMRLRHYLDSVTHIKGGRCAPVSVLWISKESTHCASQSWKFYFVELSSPLLHYTISFKYLDWLSNPPFPPLSSATLEKLADRHELYMNASNDFKTQIPPFIRQGWAASLDNNSIFWSEKLPWCLCMCLSTVETCPPNWTNTFFRTEFVQKGSRVIRNRSNSWEIYGECL